MEIIITQRSTIWKEIPREEIGATIWFKMGIIEIFGRQKYRDSIDETDLDELPGFLPFSNFLCSYEISSLK